jgi:hypothetical protein
MKANTRSPGRRFAPIRRIGIGVCACCLWVATGIVQAAPGPCSARIEVELDGEVANASDPSFLNALTASPLYVLTWVKGDGSRAVYDLVGPANDTGCQRGIEQIRRSASVLDLRVL